MARRILVVPVNHTAGVTAACLGLVHALESRRIRVGFCKPFAQARTVGDDHSTELFRLTTSLRPPQPIPVQELENQLAGGRLARAMRKIVDLTSELDADSQVLVLEGLAPSSAMVYSDRINGEVALGLDTEVLLVGGAGDVAPERFADQVAASALLYRTRGESRVVGVLIDHVSSDEAGAEYAVAVEARGLTVVGTVVDRPSFTRPRVLDVVRALDLEVLSAANLERRVAESVIAAQAVPGFIPSLTPGTLVIAPGDRHDVLLAVALAEAGGLHLAGLLLTAGITPDPDVMRLVEPAVDGTLPLLLSSEKTLPTAQRMLGMDREIPDDDEERARSVMVAVASGYDEAWLHELPRHQRPQRTTPVQLERRVSERLHSGVTRLAIADATDPRVLRAIASLGDHDGLQFLLVGSADDVDQRAAEAGITLPMSATFVDADEAAPHLDEVYERVRAAGLEPDSADPLLEALALLRAGTVDGVVGGLGVEPEALLATLQAVVPLRSDVRTLSSTQAALFPDEAVLLADSLVNTHPTAEHLACIAAQTAATARLCGIVPQVAFVEPNPWSTTAAADRAAIEQARRILAEHRPDLPTMGPQSYQEASRRTATVGDGNANVFVFPDVASAASTAKAVSQGTGARVQAPVLQGLTQPVNLLPADASPERVRDIVLATALQAAYAG